MSRESRDRVWALPKDAFSDAEVLLLLALAERADRNGTSWPSRTCLEEMTGITARQQQRHCQRLEGSKVLSTIPGGGRHLSNTYVLSHAVMERLAAARKDGAQAAVSGRAKPGHFGAKPRRPGSKTPASTPPQPSEPSFEPSLLADAPPVRRRAAKTVRPKTKAPDRPPPDPRVAVLLAAFGVAHQQHLRAPYLVVGGRDGAWLKRALATYPEADIRRALTAFFADRRARARFGADVPLFVKRLGTLLAEVAPATPDFTDYTRRPEDEEGSGCS
jgi:hypothetical protein